jgi:outer membrane autotransporter protein
MACCSVDDGDDRFEKAPPWNTWVLGYGMGGDVSSDGNAASVDYTLMGTAVGVDSDLDEFTSLGVAYGFTPFLIDRNSDRIDAETHQISAYANRRFGMQYLLGVVSFGRNDFEATRRIAFDGVNETAESEFSSGQFAFYVEAGGNRNLGSYFIQPLVGLQYVNVSQDAFDETGADSLNLTIPKSSADSLRSALGGRVARPFFTESGGMVAPELRARWMHEFLNDPQTISPSFDGADDDSFAIQGVKLGRDFLVLGAGITGELTPSISAFVNYDAQISAHEQAHGGNGGLKWVW